MKRYIGWCLVALLSLLMGCTREGAPDEGKMITFEMEWVAMRSGLVENEANFHEDMQVTAFLQALDGSPVGTFFQDLQVTKASGWSTGYPWFGSEADRKLSFYAFAPHGALTPAWDQMSYTLTGNSGEVDIVAAEKVVPAHYGRPVPLHFQHLLSGVSFVVHQDTPDMTIYSVEIQGVPSTATYSVTHKRWTNYSDPKTYTWSDEVKHISGRSEDTHLTVTPFFLLPQTLSDEVKMVVKLKQSGSSDTELKELSLKGKILDIGQHYVVRLQQAEEGATLTYELLPWDLQMHKKGFIDPSAIEMLRAPQWGENGPVLTEIDSRAELTFTFLRPIGVEWKATLTNGLDFAFDGARGGVTAMDKSFTLKVKPLKPAGPFERKTELYLTMYGKEIDPDRYPGGDGPVGRGKGRRYVIVQKAKE